MRKNGEIECGERFALIHRRLEIVRTWSTDLESQRPRDGNLSALPLNVARHRSMRHAKTGFVESGQQKSGIAVAKIELLPRALVQPWQHRIHDAIRPIAAPRPPQRLEIRVVRHFDKSIAARCILAGKMPPREKTLRMKDQL